jgi:hypothetical protein
VTEAEREAGRTLTLVEESCIARSLMPQGVSPTAELSKVQAEGTRVWYVVGPGAGAGGQNRPSGIPRISGRCGMTRVHQKLEVQWWKGKPQWMFRSDVECLDRSLRHDYELQYLTPEGRGQRTSEFELLESRLSRIREEAEPQCVEEAAAARTASAEAEREEAERGQRREHSNLCNLADRLDRARADGVTATRATAAASASLAELAKKLGHVLRVRSPVREAGSSTRSPYRGLSERSDGRESWPTPMDVDEIGTSESSDTPRTAVTPREAVLPVADSCGTRSLANATFARLAREWKTDRDLDEGGDDRDGHWAGFAEWANDPDGGWAWDREGGSRLSGGSEDSFLDTDRPEISLHGRSRFEADVHGVEVIRLQRPVVIGVDSITTVPVKLLLATRPSASGSAAA